METDTIKATEVNQHHNFLLKIMIGNNGSKIVPILIPLICGIYAFILQIHIGMMYYNATQSSLSHIHYLYIKDVLFNILVYRLALPVAMFLTFVFPVIFYARHFIDKINITVSYWLLFYSWVIIYFIAIALDERWIKTLQYTWIH